MLAAMYMLAGGSPAGRFNVNDVFHGHPSMFEKSQQGPSYVMQDPRNAAAKRLGETLEGPGKQQKGCHVRSPMKSPCSPETAAGCSIPESDNIRLI